MNELILTKTPETKERKKGRKKERKEGREKMNVERKKILHK